MFGNFGSAKISLDVSIGNFNLTRTAGGFGGGATQNTHVYLLFTFNA